MPQIYELNQITYAQWKPLWQAYLDFYTTSFNEQQALLSWQRLTSPLQKDMFGFAICVNNQVVGFVHLIAHSSTWTALPYCYLQDLYIDKAFRNQGLARKLIEFSYQFTQGKYDRVYWLTHESNETAQYLYRRIATPTGFIQYKKSLN